MWLKSNQEIVGTLLAVKDEDSWIKLQFTCLKEIDLPLTAVPREQLSSLFGERIGILNVDEKFFIREIKRGRDYER